MFSQDFKDIVDQFPDDKLLSPAEMEEQFPALRNLPSDYLGLLNESCGVVKARRSLEVVRKLAEEKYGASLMFKTKVVKVTQNSVETENGDVFHADNVVIAAGAYSAEDFDTTSTAKRLEVEYYVFQDISGLPSGIVEFAEDGNEYYGMVDGPNFDQYKMGDFSNRNFKGMLNYFRLRMPDKLDSMKYTHP